MAGFISYKVINDAQFSASVKRARETVNDLRPAFKLIANDFYLSQKAIFNLKSAGGYPDFKGKKIGQLRKAPLQFASRGREPIPSSFDGYTPYQYYKERETGFSRGYPLLKRTGRLERATTTPNSPDSILVAGKYSLEIGTDLPYANFHQSGGPKIPMRKFLFIGTESQFKGDEGLSGRLPRWNNILNNFVLRSMGARVR